MKRVEACACCHATDLVVLFEATDYLTQDRFQVVKCQQCGLAMTSPVPNEEEMSKYYPEAYYGAGKKRFKGFVEALIRLERERRARAIVKSQPQAGRILDVGCGRGIMLRKLKEEGWEGYGSELSQSMTQQLKMAGVHICHERNLQNCRFPDGFFDVVSLWHSFEHLRDPCAILDEIHRMLKPEGIAVFAVPNRRGWLSRLTRQNWFALDVPRHLFHYDIQSLPLLMESHGFRIEYVSTLSLEQDVLGVAQSIMNSAGFRQNALYDLLRRREAQSFRSHSLPESELATLVIVGTILLTLSLPFCLAAWVAQSGGTLEVWCRK
jgi:ubiquinone/menaquinone biosynthesis C-methylase UbiE